MTADRQKVRARILTVDRNPSLDLLIFESLLKYKNEDKAVVGAEIVVEGGITSDELDKVAFVLLKNDSKKIELKKIFSIEKVYMTKKFIF